MPTPPPRKFVAFQIHLSTAMVMMFVAGGVIWANIRARTETNGRAFPPPARGETLKEYGRRGNPLSLDQFMRERKDYQWMGHRIFKYGWPYDSRRLSIFGLMDASDLKWEGEDPKDDWHPDAIVINAFVALAILLAAWFLCEWPIRRRAAQKGA